MSERRMETMSSTFDPVERERDAFVELLRSTSGVFDIFSIYIGDQLGFFRCYRLNC